RSQIRCRPVAARPRPARCPHRPSMIIPLDAPRRGGPVFGPARPAHPTGLVARAVSAARLASTPVEPCSSTALDLRCGHGADDIQASTQPDPEARPTAWLECRTATEARQGFALRACRAERPGAGGGPGGTHRARWRHVLDGHALG